MNFKHAGTVRQGKLLIYDLNFYYKDLKRYEGKPVEVVIRNKSKDRSNEQNRYLWGFVYKPISDCWGYTPEEVHDIFKIMFLKESNEGRPDRIKSTTELSVEEFTAYINDIKNFILEFYPQIEFLEMEKMV